MALAVSMTVLRGTAARVARIMPVAYSPVTARTAMTATTAWPTSVPVRLSWVMSGWQAAEDVQDSAAEAPALTATVTATTPSSSHPVPGRVRTLTHSALTALVMRPSGGAGTRPGRGRAAAQAHSTASPAHGGSG